MYKPVLIGFIALRHGEPLMIFQGPRPYRIYHLGEVVF